MRSLPHPEDKTQLAGELVRGLCAVEGEDIWRSVADDRKEVEKTKK